MTVSTYPRSAKAGLVALRSSFFSLLVAYLPVAKGVPTVGILLYLSGIAVFQAMSRFESAPVTGEPNRYKP